MLVEIQETFVRKFEVRRTSLDIYGVRPLTEAGNGYDGPMAYVFTADGLRHCTEHMAGRGVPVPCGHLQAVIAFEREVLKAA